jgi:hypothetical protein
MTEKGIYSHVEREPIGQFLRVGNTGHRQLERWLGSGRVLLDRVVLDAAAVTGQRNLIEGLAASGADPQQLPSGADVRNIGGIEQDYCGRTTVASTQVATVAAVLNRLTKSVRKVL